MKPIQRGKKFFVYYRCPNYQGVVHESFNSEAEAQLRIAQIEVDKLNGTLTPPTQFIDPDYNPDLYRENITVEQLLEEFVALYGHNHWSESTLSSFTHYINDYINPHLGVIPVKKLTTRRIEQFYQALLSQPAYEAGCRISDTKTISAYTVKRIHALLRNALNHAIRWDYLQNSNPAAAAQLPRIKKHQRDAWTENEAAHALSVCEDSSLKLCMILALGCSMRIGEILGLTWDCVHFSDPALPEDVSYLSVTKELNRCNSASLEALTAQGFSDIMFSFPDLGNRKNKATTLVLKQPKTESSVRKIFLPRTVEQALLNAREMQQQNKVAMGRAYDDFDLVVCNEIGHPIEAHAIRDKFNALISKNNLRRVVFHSLRHTSTGLKLKLSNGDIKAVQGDTGHAQANMVTDVYSHIVNEDRIALAQKVDDEFFNAGQSTQKKAASQSDATRAVIQLLQESPEMAELFLKMRDLMSGK